MSRTTNYIGLNSRAKEFLNGSQPPFKTVQVDCLSDEDKRFYTVGMFDEEVPLGVFSSQSTLKKIFEIEQAAPWSSGPCIFTCLFDPETGTRIGEWTQDEIDERI